jgi:hypothetical protein
MKVYYAVIKDYKGVAVLSLPFTGSAKHSAFLALEYINSIPFWTTGNKAFDIRIMFPSPSEVAKLLNNG